MNQVHPSAHIGSNSTIGCFTIVGENVTIGDNCQIGHHVVIHPDTIIDNNVRIDDHATVGKLPMKAVNSALTQLVDLDPAVIEEGVLVGTSAIIYRGAYVSTNALVADQASVRELSRIGKATIIGRGVTIENKVTVGDRTKIEAGAYIATFSEIGDDCFVAPEVTVTNDNFMGRTEERKKHFKGITIQNGGRVGANTTLLPGLTIEGDGVAAAGSVVTKDIPEAEVVAGVPARPFGPVPTEQLLEERRKRRELAQPDQLVVQQIVKFFENGVVTNGQS